MLPQDNIDVTVKDGEVTLSGSANSRAEKRRAEDAIDEVSGVKDVHNQLRVVNEAGEIEGDTSGKQSATAQSEGAKRSTQPKDGKEGTSR